MNFRNFKSFIILFGFFLILCPADSWVQVIVLSLFSITVMFMGAALKVFYPQHIEINLKKFFLYVFWLLKEIFFASIDTIKVILGFSELAPTITKIQLEDKGMTEVMFANSITLTPGTVAIEQGKKYILVHSLNKDFESDLVGSNMYRRINKLKND